MRKLFALICLIAIQYWQINAQEVVTRDSVSGIKYSDLSYKTGTGLSTYETERCKLDVYIPKGTLAKYPVIVYFHGGGLTSGDKSEGWADWCNFFGYKFLKANVAMVMVNYRLSGQNGAKWPDYLNDAASAVAWVQNNIAKYGGDADNIFIMGFSAGAYLTHMMGIDFQWLKNAGADRSKIRGFLPISGQTRFHGTVAKDLGIGKDSILLVKPAAIALGNVKKTDKPVHIFVGEKEGNTIVDNNTYYNELLKMGSADIYFYIQPIKDHGGMRDGLGDAFGPTRDKILEFIEKYSLKATK